MKYIALAAVIVLSLGCTKTAYSNDPEDMADLASQLKDIAAAVDGTLKFSTNKFDDPQTLLLAAINNDTSKIAPFEGYQLKVETQANHAVLLLCKDEVILIEDAGCTAQSDIQHWQSEQKQACQLTINTTEVCKS
ncbi:hypothetical protein [Pseudoalteromonas piscicida]|uniref:Lipoprotein n=1 Tax=Pseudoalteromonas piscicida TaxID=43662 RepID=A0A2A5JPQ6_PSEO7|nr:hypothetical protein [Pseudoalteromonas piscicida]PCK31319.1 hypothetical protein CEX98_12635 [Pseudoalteromonas piscicida]